MFSNMLPTALLLVTLQFLGIRAFVSYVNENDLNIIEVPTDIGYDVSHVFISNNAITEAAFNSSYDSLSGLWIEHNLLNDFPDLCAVNATFQELSVKDNNISYIVFPKLDCLVQLISIDIRVNPLAAIPPAAGPASTMERLYVDQTLVSSLKDLNFEIFSPELLALQISTLPRMVTLDLPDVTNLGNTLEVLHCAVLGIRYVSKERLQPLVKLRVLSLYGNPLLAIPDLQWVGSTLADLKLFAIPGITVFDLEKIRKLPNLEVLDLSGTNIATVPNICYLNPGLSKLVTNKLI